MIAHIMVQALLEAQERFAQWVRVHQVVAQAVEAINLQRALAAPLEVAQAMQRVLDQQAAFANAFRGSAIYLPEPIATDMGLAKLSFDIDVADEDEEDTADLDPEPPRRQIGFRPHSTEDEEKREDEPPAAD